MARHKNTYGQIVIAYDGIKDLLLVLHSLQIEERKLAKKNPEKYPLAVQTHKECKELGQAIVNIMLRDLWYNAGPDLNSVESRMTYIKREARKRGLRIDFYKRDGAGE